MKLIVKLRLILVHGVLLGLLTFFGFLGALMLYMQFVPTPVAAALNDLSYFAPIMGIGAGVLGLVQALLFLWIYSKQKPLIYWGLGLILAVLFGGLASFFSIWMIWLVVAVISLFLDWLLMVLIQRALDKAKLAGPV